MAERIQQHKKKVDAGVQGDQRFDGPRERRK
jgi:hypothetical protein